MYGSHPIWPSEYASFSSGNFTSTPENRKSERLAIALPKLRLAATATGASADVAGIFELEPMCMQTTFRVSWHAAKKGSHSPEWMLGRPRCGGISEKHTARTPRAAFRRTPAAAVPAPLLHHPVVVRRDARRRELTVLGLEERLAAEARERRERERGLDV